MGLKTTTNFNNLIEATQAVSTVEEKEDILRTLFDRHVKDRLAEGSIEYGDMHYMGRSDKKLLEEIYQEILDTRVWCDLLCYKQVKMLLRVAQISEQSKDLSIDKD